MHVQFKIWNCIHQHTDTHVHVQYNWLAILIVYRFITGHFQSIRVISSDVLGVPSDAKEVSRSLINTKLPICTHVHVFLHITNSLTSYTSYVLFKCILHM